MPIGSTGARKGNYTTKQYMQLYDYRVTGAQRRVGLGDVEVRGLESGTAEGTGRKFRVHVILGIRASWETGSC